MCIISFVPQNSCEESGVDIIPSLMNESSMPQKG